MELLQSLLEVFFALGRLVQVLCWTAWPWLPLGGWIAFWLFAVNWRALSPALNRGAIVPAICIAGFVIPFWAAVSPAGEATHHLAGLHVSNLIGKGVYVTALIVIALLCGSVQLSRKSLFQSPNRQ
jgi:hypothetical protein